MSEPLLPSFWMGGYEGADHVNGRGEALDLVAATGHAQRLDADYRAARRLGLLALRESIGWRLTETHPGRFDFSRARQMAEAAQRQGVHLLWTLMHYGLPPDLTLLDDALIPRFAAFAQAAARTLAPLSPAPRFYTPINEISFLSWAASATGDMGPAGLQGPAPGEDSRISGYQIKRRLVQAALAGMDAIRRADPQARFLHVEPVLHVAPQDEGDPEQQALARRITGFQWQTFDMLAGRLEPGLGGHEGALDWLGLNHYHSSQWEVPSERRLPWHLRDPRRLPLARLLHEVARRYARPLLLAETGHIGVGRDAWLHEIAGEAQHALRQGLPLQGVCLYPLLDRPDWNDTQRWHRSGLWQVSPAQPLRRRLNHPPARAVQAWRPLLRAGSAPDPVPPSPRPALLVLLPSAWEDWRAPREALVARLAAQRPVLLLEPPRAGPAPTRLTRHTLRPRVELLVLHGGMEGGWAQAPTAEPLDLLATALHDMTAAAGTGWVSWLAHWRAEGHDGWWQALHGRGLLLQAAPGETVSAELRAHARGHLQLLWPLPRARAARPGSYEAEEIGRLLQGVEAPRLWLLAPQWPPEGWASRLADFAASHPGQACVVDAPAPPGLASPANLHWLGPVAPSLQPALAAEVQAVLPWIGVDPRGQAEAAAGSGHRHPPAAQQPAEMVDGALQPLVERDLGLPAQQRLGP